MSILIIISPSNGPRSVTNVDTIKYQPTKRERSNIWFESGPGEPPRLQHMTHLCAIIDAAHAPKKRGSYKKRRARGHDGLV
jgi:hypothetical protein